MDATLYWSAKEWVQLEPKKVQKLVVGLRVMGQPAQSTLEKANKSNLLWQRMRTPKDTVPLT